MPAPQPRKMIKLRPDTHRRLKIFGATAGFTLDEAIQHLLDKASSLPSSPVTVYSPSGEALRQVTVDLSEKEEEEEAREEGGLTLDEAIQHLRKKRSHLPNTPWVSGPIGPIDPPWVTRRINISNEGSTLSFEIDLSHPDLPTEWSQLETQIARWTAPHGSQEAQDWADTRNTSLQVRDAILVLTEGLLQEAERVWESPTPEEDREVCRLALAIAKAQGVEEIYWSDELLTQEDT